MNIEIDAEKIKNDYASGKTIFQIIKDNHLCTNINSNRYYKLIFRNLGIRQKNRGKGKKHKPKENIENQSVQNKKTTLFGMKVEPATKISFFIDDKELKILQNFAEKRKTNLEIIFRELIDGILNG